MRFKGKHRVSKQDLKEDRFQEVIEKVASAYYRDKQKFWVIGGVILAVVVGSILLIQNRGQRSDAEADLRFTEALGVFVQGDMQKAEEAFMNVASRFGRDFAGKKAHYYLGHIYYSTQRYDEAKQEFQQFLKGARKNPVLGPAAQMGWADCEEQLGEYVDAAQGYERVYQDYPHYPLSFDAMMAAGRAYIQAGELDRAESVYKELADSDPSGDEAERVKVQLSYVRTLQDKF